jgi:hypothetical protein
LAGRHASPFIRDVLARFRREIIDARQAAAELDLSRSRFYVLYASYLCACASRQQHRWEPTSSGGDHRLEWPSEVLALLRKLLGAKPPLSYSFAASEVLRRHELRLDRASIRRFALREALAPDTRHKRQPKPVRRWQVQQIGQLWQYDASPHRWFLGQAFQPVLLELIDDHSRLIPAARLYARETLLAHLDLLSRGFANFGLPLVLYVDHHSFFFTSQPDAFTRLGAALRFYEISLRFAPTPQAKGKIERAHDFWQKRLPPLFAAEHVATLPEANLLLDSLRDHHNRHEQHREIHSTPQAAWSLAIRERRSVLRPAPKCPWWPYIFSQRSQTRVAPDGRVAIGSQRLRIEQSPGTLVTRCVHPDGDISVLLHPPQKSTRPVLLFRSAAAR